MKSLHRACLFITCLVLLVLAGCRSATPTSHLPTAVPPAPMPEQPQMQLTSSAFADGADIPAKHTCDGEDLSPPLSWSAPPQGTASLVLLCDDPDGGNWVHWLLYDLPPDLGSLSKGVPPVEVMESGAKQGRNSFGKIGYGGPCPPAGGAHRYYFRLFAIDIAPTLRPGMTKAEVLKAIEGHVLAEAQWMGRYKRP